MAFWRKHYTSKYTGPEIDEAIGNAISGGLPEIEDGDGGKVLTADGETKKWVAASLPSQLPEIGPMDGGKFVKATIVSAEKSYVLDSILQLPSVSAADRGKLLTVSNVGAWTATEPSKTFIDINVTVDLDTSTAMSDKNGTAISANLQTGKVIPYCKYILTVDGNTYIGLAKNIYSEGSAYGAPVFIVIEQVTTATNTDTYRYIVIKVAADGTATIHKNVSFTPAV